MRTTNAQTLAIARQSMNSNFQSIARLQTQIASGKKHRLPSDDPVTTLRSLRMRREEAGVGQYQENIAAADVGMRLQETGLTSASEAFQEIRKHLLWAKNDANSGKDLGSIATQLQGLEQAVFDNANVRDEEGRFLLSGTLSHTPALTFTPGANPAYTLTGNDQRRGVVVGNGVLTEGNVTASSVYGNGVELLNALHELTAQLKAPTATIGATLDDALAKLDSTHDRLLQAVTELGGRQNTLQLLSDNYANASALNNHSLEELEGFDLADGRLQMDNYMVSMQFSLKAWASIGRLSLFDQM